MIWNQNNSYFKILLRRRHLVVLLLILFLTVVFCLFMWPPVVKTFLRQELQGPLGFATVILAGILGAGVSVAQSLLSTDLSAKIPAQQIGSDSKPADVAFSSQIERLVQIKATS